VCEQKHTCDQQQQDGYDLVERFGLEARRPGCSGIGANKAARQQIQDDRPMRIYFGKGNGAGTKWQRAGHHDQARRLVEDHGFKTAKPEQADE